MTTTLQTALIVSVCETIVSASYSLAQAQEKLDSGIGQLANLIKPALDGVDFPAWEAVRKSVQKELIAKYKGRGASDEVATNNADKRWSEAVAKAGLTKPASTSNEAQKKAKQRASESDKALAAQQLAEGKTPAELLKLATESAADPEKMAAYSDAARYAVRRDIKARQAAEKKVASDAKKSAADAVKSALTATPEQAFMASQAVKFAAEHPDAVAAFAAVYDQLVALQIANGHSVEGKVTPVSMADLLQGLINATPTKSANKRTRAA